MKNTAGEGKQCIHQLFPASCTGRRHIPALVDQLHLYSKCWFSRCPRTGTAKGVHTASKNSHPLTGCTAQCHSALLQEIILTNGTFSQVCLCWSLQQVEVNKTPRKSCHLNPNPTDPSPLAAQSSDISGYSSIINIQLQPLLATKLIYLSSESPFQ